MGRGVVTKLEFELTGGFLADAKIVGRKLSNNAAAYAGEEIHAGARSFIKCGRRLIMTDQPPMRQQERKSVISRQRC